MLLSNKIYPLLKNTRNLNRDWDDEDFDFFSLRLQSPFSDGLMSDYIEELYDDD